MKKYERPIITISPDVLEGVYMGSGAKPILSNLEITQDWKTGGTAICTVDMSLLPLDNLTLFFTFNMDIADCWINGGTQRVVGSTVSINFYSAPASATLFVNVNQADINHLQIVDVSYKND